MITLKINTPKRTPKPKKNYEFIVETPMGLLDFLILKLSDKSRNSVKFILTSKAVSVDGKTVTRHDLPLKTGQTVKIAPPELLQHRQKASRLKIVYEDDELIAVDKPSGLLSIATDTEKEKTVYHYVTDYVRLTNPDSRIFVVHRLDRDTSGVLIFAKNERLKHALQDDWNNLVSARGYIVLVEGVLSEKSGKIKSWIKETKTHIMYTSGIRGDGLEAITNYEVMKESARYSLLKINLETGRKNQIRVHMKDLGHPVAGDKTYGAETDPLKRLALHADKLELRHPFTEKLMVFESPLPHNFLSLIQNENVKR